MTSALDDIKSLRALAEAESECRRCPLYKNATGAVPGEGPRNARFVLVGEQPGDKEDLAGKPFVGPAGRLLDTALETAGIERKDVYVTNAVKHFKHEMRGKRRLHKRPNAYEIERCRIWLDTELRLVKPAAIIALGVSAARGLTGKPLTIKAARQVPQKLPDNTPLFVTVHPSSLLRIKDSAERRDAYAAFVDDLKAAFGA